MSSNVSGDSKLATDLDELITRLESAEQYIDESVCRGVGELSDIAGSLISVGVMAVRQLELLRSVRRALEQEGQVL